MRWGLQIFFSIRIAVQGRSTGIQLSQKILTPKQASNVGESRPPSKIFEAHRGNRHRLERWPLSGLARCSLLVVVVPNSWPCLTNKLRGKEHRGEFEVIQPDLTLPRSGVDVGLDSIYNHTAWHTTSFLFYFQIPAPRERPFKGLFSSLS